MADREKVIKAIEICYFGKHNCTECDLFYVKDCNDKLMRDTLDLLKEQEAIKPTAFVDKDTGDTRYVCSNCWYDVLYEELVESGIVEIKHSYCPRCGRKVKWE